MRGCVDPELARRMVDWFEHRPDVNLVRAHPGSATIDVRYDDRALEGELLRAARDHAFAISRPPRQRRPARRRRVAIAHSVPGRTRVAVPDATATELARLSSWLVDQQGVLAAEPGLDSIVVRSEVGQHDARTLAGAIAASDRSEWPPAPPLDDGSPWLSIAFDSALLIATRRAVVARPVVALGVAVSAIPTARRTLTALEERRIGVDLLDLIAIAVSVAVGTPGTAALITWLLAIGDYILHLTRRKARSALAGAVKLDVPTAWRIRADGQTERIATKKLRVGDHVLCELGVRLPADGVITKGAATIDTKALTGESMPRICRQGDAVMASSVVVDGSIVVEIRRTGRDTAAGRIVQILQSAEEKPTTLQRETERIADRVVVPTLALAGASALLSSEIDRMTSILITDFGTGIRISVPTSALAAMTLATRNGVLVKGGQFLERLARTDAIVFDKTGTLTSGNPEIVDVVAMNGADPRAAIALAAAIETRQSHPVAQALRAYVRAESIAVPSSDVHDHSYVIGKGLVARCGPHAVAVGGERLMASKGIPFDAARATLTRHEEASISSLLVAIDGRLAAILGYADTVRPESRSVIRALQENGRRRIVLMSGDASGPAGEIGRQLEVDEVYSELLPHQKAEQVRRLQRSGRTVAMVGDGINDAPALALADVGISLTGGTDIALDTADVVLLSGGLSKLPDAFRIGDRAMRMARIGLGIVIVPNALAIGLGALGLIGPGMATVMNNGSTVVAALAALSPILRR